MMDNKYYKGGSTRDLEIEELKKLASESKDIIVEIGGFQGRTSIELAKGSKEGQKHKIYVIDPWTGVKVHSTKDVFIDKNTFVNNIKNAKMDDIIIPIQSLSEKCLPQWDKSIGMLFIDGDHSYDGVKKDIKWIKHVIPGGIVAFHDYLLPKYKNSVVKAVNEIKDTLDFQTHIESLIVFKKR